MSKTIKDSCIHFISKSVTPPLRPLSVAKKGRQKTGLAYEELTYWSIPRSAVCLLCPLSEAKKQGKNRNVQRWSIPTALVTTKCTWVAARAVNGGSGGGVWVQRAAEVWLKRWKNSLLLNTPRWVDCSFVRETLILPLLLLVLHSLLLRSLSLLYHVGMCIMDGTSALHTF